jgi:hypothetical protein
MSEEEEEWKQQYINMTEIQYILKNNPYFDLKEEDAKTFARYLVEDSQNDFVYCDPANENLRSIVKSIVKQEVGAYEPF